MPEEFNGRWHRDSHREACLKKGDQEKPLSRADCERGLTQEELA